MPNGIHIYVHTSGREVNYSHLHVAMLSNVANWNSGKNFSPSNVHHFPPGKEDGLTFGLGLSFTPEQMFMDVMGSLL